MMFDFGTAQQNPETQDMQKQALIQMLGGGMGAPAMQRGHPVAGGGLMGGVANGINSALGMYMMKQRMQKPPMLSTPIPQANPALTGAGDLPMVG